MRCYMHGCGQTATHVITTHNPHDLDIDDQGPRYVCSRHMAYELEIWADVVGNAQTGTKQAYVTEIGTSVTITPIRPEDGQCPHNGLFATGAPEYGTPAYSAWLAETRHCYACGADVPNGDL